MYVGGQFRDRSPAWCLLSAGLSLCLLLVAGGALGDPLAGRGLKPDLRLLIDISGSMKQSDPDNLREPALELIVRLLPDGARAGVWTFGESVEVLVPHQEVDAAWRQQARDAVARIDNSGQRTNIPAALAAATYDLGSMDPAYRSSIVLLTDGKVDVSPSPMANANAARKLLAETAPRLGGTGIPVHTIALSGEADWPFLRDLAEQTAGIAEQALTAEDLTTIFVQSLEMVAPAARVPIADSRFVVDDSIEEFTALIFLAGGGSPQVGLFTPAGSSLRPEVDVEGVDWFRTDRFALVTVRSPAPGAWQLEAPPGARVRVTVIADLQLEVDPLPNSIPADRASEVGILLRNEGEVVTDPELLALFDISLEIIGPGGESRVLPVSGRYPVPATGEYRVSVPPFARGGRYQLVARVNGKTLRRELPMYVEVIDDAQSSAISTRPANIPEASLRTPLLVVASVVTAVTVLSLWIARRRRLRRLDIWKRRFQDSAGDSEDRVVEGVVATDPDPDGR